MFNPLFGTNTNFDEGSTSSIVDDAKSIQNTIDFIFIKAAWDEYSTIKQRDPSYDPEFIMPNPAWSGLTKLIECEGDLSQFSSEEQRYIRALLRGFVLYADVLHVLIDHHDDLQASHELFAKYPELKDYMPKQYAGEEYVVQVMIEVVKDYQWQLEHFAQKHHDVLSAALA